MDAQKFDDGGVIDSEAVLNIEHTCTNVGTIDAKRNPMSPLFERWDVTTILQNRQHLSEVFRLRHVSGREFESFFSTLCDEVERLRKLPK